MGKNNSNINKIKQYEKLGKDVSMVVKNLKNGMEGTAILTAQDKVAVFEGKDDGSDDKIYSLEELTEIMKLLD